VETTFPPPGALSLAEPLASHNPIKVTFAAETTRLRFARTILVACAFFLANQGVEHLVLSSICMSYSDVQGWDNLWYAKIISHGYDRVSKVEDPTPIPSTDGRRGNAANWAFFPLFPLLARLPQALFGLPPLMAAVLLSKICFFFSIIAFMEFFRLYKPDTNAAFAAMAVSLNPYAIYGNVGYTEPLFLMLTCIFFIQLKRKRNIPAGMTGALLSATRFVGLSAMAAYVAANAAAIASGRIKIEARILLGFLLIPLGLACFMIFLHHQMGDALAFLHVQRAWGRAVGNPLETLRNGLAGGPLNRYLALTGLAALAAPVALLRARNFELATFSWCCTLAPLATGLVSMPRFTWWQAPLLLLVASLLAWRKAWIVLLPTFIAGLAYFTRGWFLKADYLV